MLCLYRKHILQKKNYLNTPSYNIYDVQHLDETTHDGTTIIVRVAIKHYVNANYTQDYLQATSITLGHWLGLFTLAAIYSPPKHSISQDQYTSFFKSLGRFIAGGDYNAKHPWWGSRSHISTPKGRQLYQSLLENNLYTISTGEPTYWPSDRRKKPNVIDFCVVKGISTYYFKAESCYDLSSNHSPILVTPSSAVLRAEKPLTLCNKELIGTYLGKF